MAKAIWEGTVLAESSQCVEVEGDQYFPPDVIKIRYTSSRVRRTPCARGRAPQVITTSKLGGKRNQDAAWFYPDIKPGAKRSKGTWLCAKGVKVEK